MTIKSFAKTTPALAPSVFVDDSALVVGDVSIGPDSSIWPMSVLRGDVNRITIGSRTNIQDSSVLHVTHAHQQQPDGFALCVGDNVTVGHRVILHGCVIEDNCLIGMGSIIMDGAIVHSQVMLGAGSLVSPGKELESGYLYLGSPVKKLRPLSGEERSWIEYSATHYVKLKDRYIK